MNTKGTMKHEVTPRNCFSLTGLWQPRLTILLSTQSNENVLIRLYNCEHGSMLDHWYIHPLLTWPNQWKSYPESCHLQICEARPCSSNHPCCTLVYFQSNKTFLLPTSALGTLHYCKLFPGLYKSLLRNRELLRLFWQLELQGSN